VVTVSATVTDASSGIFSVTFSVGGTVRTVTAPPYAITWSVPGGKPNVVYAITVTAKDQAGNSRTVTKNVTAVR
jgi:hypothetical protein